MAKRRNELREFLSGSAELKPKGGGHSKEEHEQQVMFVEWLIAMDIGHFACINGAILGGRNKYAVLEYLKAEGMVNGAPDLVIIDRPPADETRHVIIEMKKLKGGVRSPEQRELHDRAWENGWIVIVGNGFMDTKRKMEDLGWRGRRR